MRHHLCWYLPYYWNTPSRVDFQNIQIGIHQSNHQTKQRRTPQRATRFPIISIASLIDIETRPGHTLFPGNLVILIGEKPLLVAPGRLQRSIDALKP